MELRDDKVGVYKKNNLYVFHAPLPYNQQFQKGGAEEYAKIMRDLLVRHKMFCPLPDVLNHGLSPESKEILIKECSAEKMNKFEAIARIAHELYKQKSCMTARTLCVEILNNAGH